MFRRLQLTAKESQESWTLPNLRAFDKPDSFRWFGYYDGHVNDDDDGYIDDEYYVCHVIATEKLQGGLNNAVWDGFCSVLKL